MEKSNYDSFILTRQLHFLFYFVLSKATFKSELIWLVTVAPYTLSVITIMVYLNYSFFPSNSRI